MDSNAKAKNAKKGKKPEIIEYSPRMTLDQLDREESGCDIAYDKIDPAFNVNNVAVCMVSSNEYAPFAAVLVQSIIANSTPNHNYDIVILSDDMMMRNGWRIKKLAESHPNFSIRIMDISKIVEGFSFYTWARFTSKTYYRLLTPDLFSAYEKVLYLDSDIVVNHDVAELYNTDLGDWLLAMAFDTHVVAYCCQNPPLEQRDYNLNVLKLKNPEQYFQAGVSLYNVRAFQKNFESGYLVNHATKHELRWMDQDLINMLCQGRIKRLPNQWNVMVADNENYVDEYYLPAQMRKEYFAARLDPYAVHYVGKAIPCYTTGPDLYEYFWKYARQTPFYEILLQRMVAEYADNRSVAHERMLQYTRELQGECAYLRQVCNTLTTEAGIKIPRKTKIPLRLRMRNFLMPIAGVFLPVGTPRREKVKRIYRRIRKRGMIM